MQVENLADLTKANLMNKALSGKHAYQAEHERPDGLSALLFWESRRESPRAKVRSGSKRILGSYHETHKGAGLKPIR